ncbi:SLOG family protein [Rouxiella sp. Mn2063]|uniref:SLOG family protein n=1 Tax=Rouxiella sp. Mn2063 TaxID=3395262 RepID=UPI003BDEA044
MRILITAGRFYADINIVKRMLDLYHEANRISVVIHGGHQSLGPTIENWARDADANIVRYPPNWSLHGKYAEAKRNLFMLEDSQPDAMLVFPGGEDTADFVDMARKRGIKVIETDM